MYQCSRCLAPLRVYQGQPVKVCDRCGAIQTGAAPQVVVASPSRPRSNPAPIIALVVVVLLALVGGLVAVVFLRQRAIVAGGDTSSSGSSVFGGGVSVGGQPLWDDAQRVKTTIQARLGQGAAVTEVLFYRDYAIVEVQEGHQRVRYDLRGGDFKRDDRLSVPTRPAGEKPEDAVLPLGDIDFRVLPAVVKEAQAKIGGRADDHVHVRLARHLPFIADPLWSVYMGQGNAEFNLQGKLVGGRTAQGVELDKQIANYFADPSPVAATLTRRFGAEVEVIEIVLYSSYAIAEVRDPTQRDNVDRYTIRPSGMSPGDPQRNSRTGWDSAAFRLASVKLDKVAGLAADAKSRLRGEVTHIFIEKRGFRVYVSDARNSGYVSYHPDGRLERVMD